MCPPGVSALASLGHSEAPAPGNASRSPALRLKGRVGYGINFPLV